jgi:hypothetical protein
MNRIDELLGVATFAAAGMFAAIAIAPVTSIAATAAAPRVVTADPLSFAPVVVLPSVHIVARRSVEMARIEREEALDRQHLTKGVVRPGA